MKNYKVFSAKGIQVKALNKANALKRLEILDSSITIKNIVKLSIKNPHQSPVEIEYPELFI